MIITEQQKRCDEDDIAYVFPASLTAISCISFDIGREALGYIANEKIRDQLAHSGTYLNATRLYELKAFLVVLHHKTCQFNSGHLELCNVLKVDKTVDYRSVFNIEELRMKIMSYL